MRSILVLLSVLLVLPVTIHLALCSLVVFAPKMLCILVDMDQKDSYGGVGKDCALALPGVVLGFIAGCGYGADGKDCALALLGLVLVFTAACCSSSTRSYTPCHDAEVPQVVHGSSVAGVEKTVESTRGEDGQDPTCCSSLVAQCLDKVVLPIVVQDRGPDSACAVLGQGRLALCCARQEGVQTVQKPVKFPHAFLDMVVDISVVAQRQFPWAWLFSSP